ncbi:hypothetical protein F5Y16DRAFT_392326 [Xylariaceae sp. FL0255]|nr:hypothetical protein F5Y16DRAFT_392326 [Xylariaceae sp. FL0255]
MPSRTAYWFSISATMPKSDFQKWWFNQFAEPRGDTTSRPVPVCPCSSCFNGIDHKSVKARKYFKHHISMKKSSVTRDQRRDSVATDFIPLCSTDWTPRSSFETLCES